MTAFVLVVAVVMPHCRAAAQPAPAPASSAIRVTSAAEFVAALGSLRERRSAGDRSPVVIELDSDTIQLAETIQLDGALVGEGLTVRAADDRPHAQLSGAIPLAVAASDANAWRFTLPEDWEELGVPRQLLVDDRLSSPARHPNLGTHRIEKTLADRRSGFTVAPEQIPEGFAETAAQADLVFLHDWSSSRLPVASYDAATATLRTVGPIGCEAAHYAIDHFEPQPRYWLEGAEAFADQAGEWWIDREADQVVMLRDPADDAASTPPRVLLPVLETLVQVASRDDRPVRNLKIERVWFAGTRFPMPAGGLAAAQATMHEPRAADGSRLTSGRPMLSAAVQLEHVSRAVIKDCRFESLANSGLWLGSRSVECVVENCQFTDIGGNAINLGESHDRHVDGQPWFRTAPAQVPTANRVVGCEISKCGRVLPGSVAIWAALQRSLVIDGNTLRDLPYTGISLGWIWNDTPSPAEKNLIRGNTIEHPMQLLSDGGGIYTLGRQAGTIIEGNTIVGIPNAAGRAESNGMFLDEGTTGFTIRDNTIRWVAQSPLRFHRAGRNLVHDNHWELATPETQPLRFNNTPESNIETRGNEVLERPTRLFLIGNSLTWDTLPSQLDGDVYWHIDCGKSLPYIRQHPERPCVETSTLWPRGLRMGPFDFLIVQPHNGSTVEEDALAIESWLMDQPNATLVLHTGWPPHEKLRDEGSASADVAPNGRPMIHHAGYFEALRERLRINHPELRIRSTDAFELLAEIDAAIQAGRAPFDSVADLYRDSIHMTETLGRPMMHSRMRLTLGQPANFHPAASVDPAWAKYIEQRLSESATQPDEK